MIKKNKSLLIVIFIVILIGFIFKPIRIMNYSSVDKIVITNEAERQQASLMLNDNDLAKLKKALGNFAVIGFTMSIDKVLFNLRVDLYKGNKIKYTMYFYTDNRVNSEKPIIGLDPQYYKINANVHKTLNEILQDKDFSLESY